MPATESVNLFNAMATASAVLMGDALDGLPFYIGFGLTILICGAILGAVLHFIKKGRNKSLRYRRK